MLKTMKRASRMKPRSDDDHAPRASSAEQGDGEGGVLLRGSRFALHLDRGGGDTFAREENANFLAITRTADHHARRSPLLIQLQRALRTMQRIASEHDYCICRALPIRDAKKIDRKVDRRHDGGDASDEKAGGNSNPISTESKVHPSIG